MLSDVFRLSFDLIGTNVRKKNMYRFWYFIVKEYSFEQGHLNQMQALLNSNLKFMAYDNEEENCSFILYIMEEYCILGLFDEFNLI